MTGRRRILGLTALALAVPAFAFGGESGTHGPVDLGVSGSLGGCGLAETQIVCRIDTTWSAAGGADYYTVSVTRPDGSVVDLGQSTGTSRSIYVAYVGPGTYSIEVAAWGTPPDEDEPEVIAREKTFSTGSQSVAGSARNAEHVSVPGEGRGAGEGDEVTAVGDEPAESVPAPTGEERPVCDPDPADEEPAYEAEDPAAVAGDEPAPAPEAAAGEAEQDQDEPVTCP